MKRQLIKKLLALGLLFAFAGIAVISNTDDGIRTRRYYRDRRSDRGRRATTGALLGGAIGAGVGGAIGGGRGAAVGAATGVAVGATAGAASGDRYYYEDEYYDDPDEYYTETEYIVD